MERIRLSIIVPVYNVQDYLSDCLDSIVNQNVDDYEIILVDDGSTDESGTICDNYCNMYSNVKVIHKENGGLGSARNVGASTAVGHYIMFLDSDDYYMPNSLAELLDTAERDDLDILMYGAQILVEDGSSHKNTYERKNKKFNVITTGIESIDEDLNNKEYHSSACFRMIKRSFLLSTKIEYKEGIIHEDVAPTFLTCIQAKRVETKNVNPYVRRYRSGSIMNERTFEKSKEGYLYSIKEIKSYSNRTNNRSAVRVCNKFISKIIKCLVFDYCKLEASERKKYSLEMKKLIKENRMILRNNENLLYCLSFNFSFLVSVVCIRSKLK